MSTSGWNVKVGICHTFIPKASEGMELDKNHGSNQWNDANKTEMVHIDEHDTFGDIRKYPLAPVGQNNIWLHLVYGVNHGGCHKER